MIQIPKGPRKKPFPKGHFVVEVEFDQPAPYVCFLRFNVSADNSEETRKLGVTELRWYFKERLDRWKNP